MKVITITNQKGGVAKTTTAAALGFGLAEMGYKVLFVDTDAQCNLTETVYPVDEHGNIKYDFDKTIFECYGNAKWKILFVIVNMIGLILYLQVYTLQKLICD